MTTVPFAGCVTEAIDFGPPSMSVSLASTSTAVGRRVLDHRRASLTATGGSSTQVTVTETVAVEPPGVSVYVNVSGVVARGRVAVVRVRRVRQARAAAVMTTVPCAGCVTDAIDFGPPSRSVSFGEHVDRGRAASPRRPSRCRGPPSAGCPCPSGSARAPRRRSARAGTARTRRSWPARSPSMPTVIGNVVFWIVCTPVTTTVPGTPST